MGKGKVSMSKHYTSGIRPVNAFAKKEVERMANERRRKRHAAMVDSVGELMKRRKEER